MPTRLPPTSDLIGSARLRQLTQFMQLSDAYFYSNFCDSPLRFKLEYMAVETPKWQLIASKRVPLLDSLSLTAIPASVNFDFLLMTNYVFDSLLPLKLQLSNVAFAGEDQPQLQLV